MLAIAQETVPMGTFVAAPSDSYSTITTLYTLIETLQDQLGPQDDTAVTAAVARLCNTGSVKFLNVSGDREIACTYASPVVSWRRVQGGTCTASSSLKTLNQFQSSLETG